MPYLPVHLIRLFGSRDRRQSRRKAPWHTYVILYAIRGHGRITPKQVPFNEGETSPYFKSYNLLACTGKISANARCAVRGKQWLIRLGACQ